MVQAQTGTLYNINPEVVSRVTSALQQQIDYMALSSRLQPVEVSMNILEKNYEWFKEHADIGLGYELDVITPPDSDFASERIEKVIPEIFGNIGMGYDEYRRVIADPHYNLAQRLNKHAMIMAARADIYTYVGDDKHGIGAWSGIGTEFDDALNVTTRDLCVSSLTKAVFQLKAAMKYNSMVDENAEVLLELNPNVWEVAEGVSDANDLGTGITAMDAVLQRNFGASSRCVLNHYLDASATIDSNGRLTSFTEGASNAMLYVKSPMVSKVVQSPIETRVSPLDQTKGITFQPVFRTRRLDIETTAILKETAVSV